MNKYLDRYAEPELAALDQLPAENTWQNVMVIPACNEGTDFLREPPPCGGRSLMILVINESHAAGREVSLKNAALAQAAFDRFERCWRSDAGHGNFALHLLSDPRAERDVLLVDRFSEGFQLPEKGGVGHARKIGVDLACALVRDGRLKSRWIHCTDADVKLPETYFTASQSHVEREKDHAVLIYPFHHRDDPGQAESEELILATQLYELSLRYYVAGMKFAGSPYAFHTIGSTMAVNAEHYAMVRGFPRREAGEDFYLLNKLAKVGRVLELASGPECEPIEIEARRSDRVPFGTGAAVNKIIRLQDLLTDYSFYNPAVFELLGTWLQALPAIWRSSDVDLASGMLSRSEEAGDTGGSNHVLLQGLKDIGVQTALDHAFRQSKDFQQFTRHMSTWFDAFRTLKLLHYLRDHGANSMPYAGLEKHRLFRSLLTIDADLLVFYTRLSQKISTRLDDSRAS